jgi:dCMP deaminase
VERDDYQGAGDADAARTGRTSRWVSRYLGLAHLVATWSKDPSTKVGAVIFRPDGSVISLGYNGFPRGVDDTPLDRDLKLQITIHAEENAILAAGRNGTGLDDACMVVTHHPCPRCTAKIVQSGIRRVWFATDDAFEDRWSQELVISRALMEQARVQWRRT